MYNRKQRRKIEKELGLLDNLKKMSPAERKEVQKRNTTFRVVFNLKDKDFISLH
jgi:hypothetical protein